MFGGGIGGMIASQGLSSLASGLLGGLFGDDPEEAARPNLEQARTDLTSNATPWINRGTQAADTLNPIYEMLLKNPQQLMQLLQGSYQQSPGYQFNRDQALQGMNNAAASGGMSGSPMHQQQAGDIASGLASRDFNDYMQRALGLFGTGVSGTQHTADTGAGISQSLGENLASLSGAQGQYAAQGAAGRNNQMSNMFGGAASIMPFMFNGGGNNNSGSNWISPDYPDYSSSYIQPMR